MLIHDRTEAECIVSSIENNRAIWKQNLEDEDFPLWKIIKQMEEESEELNGLFNSYVQEHIDTAQRNLEDALKHLRNEVDNQIGDFEPLSDVPSEATMNHYALCDYYDSNRGEPKIEGGL